MIKPLILGAPFGNYLNFHHATSTIGTYTWLNRGGIVYRFWRVAKTLRYYPGIKAWKNKLRLPNPGINKAPSAEDKILSIMGFNEFEWNELLRIGMSLSPEMIELNISCPNVKEVNVWKIALEAAFTSSYPRDKIIVKLPPVNYEKALNYALLLGFKNFHCCNTLPTDGGGLSGKPLKQLSLRVVREVDRAVNGILIGGGGITCKDDVEEYFDAGATNVAVASVLLLPWNWLGIAKLAKALNENLSKRQQEINVRKLD